MGIPSPFIGAAVSPALGRSKQATPEIPLLEAFDELAGLEVFNLCPPYHEDFSEQKAKVLSPLDESPATPEEPPKLERTRSTEPVPEWPSHLPSYTHKVTALNTFLEVPESPLSEAEPARRRAGSDFTGMRDLERAEVDVRIEDLLEPLPPAATSAYMEAGEQDASYEQQQWWWVGDEVNGGWVMYSQAGSQMWSGEAQECSPASPEPRAETTPCLPDMPPSEEAYRPKWVYGSSWPFNYAPTTLILDSLPLDLTQAELLAVLDASGFHGLYDFVFLPASLRTGRNQGSAIINLTRHSYGLALAARAQGFEQWGPSADGSACEAKWSLPLQGISEHIENYRNHPAMHESVPEAFRPSLFMNGWQVPFPPPTQYIRAPRLGHR